MPDVTKLRMFTTSGLLQLIVFIGLLVRLLAMEYIDGEELAMGTAPAFLMMFGGTFLVASALNT
jgi:quinol-cytochrome oxidoreductase complex cytochrome b subunit